MPSYDYFCTANGRTVEIDHKMSDKVANWADLCRRAGIPIGSTPGSSPVTRLITGGNVVRAGSLGSSRERPCDTGPCGAAECGGGACAL
jgi:hypothetical protein